MSKLNRHIIQKQIFDLTIPSGKDSFALQQKVSKISNGDLKEALEQLFDRYSDEETLIQVEHLAIDLGDISWDQMEGVLVEKIIKEIELTITEKIATANEQENVIDIRQARFRYWISFLESGYFTWDVSSLTEKELHQSVLEAIENNEVAINELKLLLAKQPIALERLIKQHQEDFVKTIFQKSSGLSLNWVDEFKSELIQFFNLLRKNKRIYKKYLNLPIDGINRNVEVIFWTELGDNVLTEKVSNETLLKEKVLESALKKIVKNEELPSFFRSIRKMKKLLGKRMELDVLDESLTALAKKNTLDSTNASKEERLDSSSEKAQDIDIVQPIKSKDLKDVRTANQQKNKPKEIKETEDKKSPLSTASESKEVLKREKIDVNKNIFLEGIDEGLYIKNAGVILLHPFLSAYFKELGLLQKNKFIDQAAQEKGVHLIQFLATGETNLPEYELLLPKFLCDLASNAIIDRTINISDTEKKEGEGLLKAAINHWGVLGNITPDGLREGFLLRDGKLEKRNAGWYLQVEQKTIDILLDKLPWNLSMIQLPWMKEVLRVEWA